MKADEFLETLSEAQRKRPPLESNAEQFLEQSQPPSFLADKFLEDSWRGAGASGEWDIPWWQKAVEFMTGGHISYEPPPPPEVIHDPETGEMRIHEPESARMSFFEEPTGAPLVAALTGGILPAKSIAGRAARAAREGLGWFTGGATEAPALAKAGAKAVPEVARGASAKRLERTMAQAMERPVGQVPARIAAGKIPKPTSLLAAPARAESEMLQKQFSERFLKAKPEAPPAPFAKPEMREGVFGEKYVTEPKAIKRPEAKVATEEELVIGKGGIELYSGIPIHKSIEAWTRNIGEPIWDKMIMQKVPKLLEKVPGGKAVNRAMIYDYRADLPNTAKYLSSMEDMKRAQAIGREYAVDLGKRLQDFSEKAQLRMGEYIRGELNELPNKIEESVAKEAKNAMLDLGKQAVDVGLLSEKAFFKHAGRYMPRLYTSKEYQSLLTRFNLKKPNRLDLSRFKRRKDIPKAIREEMGEILTPGYPIAKGITQLTHDIELQRWFKGIAQNSEWSLSAKAETIPETWKQLPKVDKLGALKGKYVHPEIYADLQETIRIMDKPERFWRKSLGAWKFGKVILSPKTHVRNLMSNSILAHLGGLPMYEQPVYLTKAAKQMRNKGDYWNQVKQLGGMEHTFTSGELNALFDRVEGQMAGIRAGSLPEKFGVIGNSWGKTKKGLKKAADLYQAEEQWFKMAKYIHNVERRAMAPAEAWKDAEKWLFNYSKVTRFQEKYRNKWYGAPFATFTLKALPRIAEAAIKYPWRFILPGSMIYGLEEAARRKIGDTREEAKAKKALRPEWMKGKVLGLPNFARVPLLDEYGREHYLNLTYILPWGDIGESGKFGPIPGSLVPMSQPFVKEPMQQILNYDSFWKEPIVKKKEIAGLEGIEKTKKQVLERLKHTGQALLPTPVIDISKTIDAIKGQPDYRGRFREPKTVAADVIAGVKMYPVDYVDQVAREIGKIHPQKGWLARKLHGDIRRLAIKKKALEDKGRNADFYTKRIEQIKKQLEGLAKEAGEIGKIYEKANLGENR